MAKPIYDITPFTLIDYPDKTACIIWFAGCNMRCVYCYNPDIVLGKGKMSFEDVCLFLQKRKNLLDGVVLSGGECTMHKHLKEFIMQIKSMGFLVKIDTNGSNPALMRLLIQEELVDYISLDFKAPPHLFKEITQSDLYKPFEQTLDILSGAALPFEVRTTVHSDLLQKSDLHEMISYLHGKNYKHIFYIQQHINNTRTLGNVAASDNDLHSAMFADELLEVVVRN